MTSPSTSVEELETVAILESCRELEATWEPHPRSSSLSSLEYFDPPEHFMPTNTDLDCLLQEILTEDSELERALVAHKRPDATHKKKEVHQFRDLSLRQVLEHKGTSLFLQPCDSEAEIPMVDLTVDFEDAPTPPCTPSTTSPGSSRQNSMSEHSKLSSPPMEIRRGRRTWDAELVEENKLPLTLQQIANMNLRELRQKMTFFKLSHDQKVLVYKIRRRAKNRVAARNCRERREEIIRQRKLKKTEGGKKCKTLSML